MNSKRNSESKKIILMILIICLVAIGLVSGTYALLSGLGEISNITNNVYQHTTECFEIEYEKGDDIRGTLIPSSTPVCGLSGSLTLGVSDDCNVIGTGSINLVIDSKSNEKLVEVVDAHCEDSTTLQTLKDYKDETSCTTNSGIWVTTGTALKYALYVDEEINPASVGYINAVGTTLSIYDNFDASDVKNYTIKVWLDGNLSDNTYANLSFSSSIHSQIVQITD